MKLNLKAIARSMGMALQKHSPEILTGIGIAGMVTTTILAVRATPKALLLIQEAEEVKHQNTDASALTPVETIKAAWLCYVPAAVTGVLSMTCLIGASSVNLRRNAALATAYTLSESALKEYREKVVETIGEKKEQAVQDAVAKERISKSPVTNQEVIITEKGNTLCYDVISGRYFKSDIEKLKRAANDLSRRMLDVNSVDYTFNNGRLVKGEFYPIQSDVGTDGVYHWVRIQAGDKKRYAVVLEDRSKIVSLSSGDAITWCMAQASHSDTSELEKKLADMTVEKNAVEKRLTDLKAYAAEV